MAQYAVTGVRYQMEEGLTLEEKTRKAEEFIKKLKDGTPVILMAEPDNPKDSEAIAVYMDFTCRVGYIKHESCKEVKPLLNGDGQCDAVVCGNDGHVTFHIDIPDAPEANMTVRQTERVLPECPLPQGLNLAFTKEEQGLQVVAPRLMSVVVNADSAARVLDMAERYMPLSRLSLCYEDDHWRDHILKQFRKARRLKLPQEQKERFEQLYEELQDTMGDFHRVHEQWQLRVFEAQLEKAKVQAEEKDGLFERFEKYANQAEGGLSAAVSLLQAWFEAMPHVKLRNPKDHRQLAETLNYQRVSRQELYDVYAAVLLLEKYDGTEGNVAPMDTNTDKRKALEKKPAQLNYFAPIKHLQNLLKEPWFKEVRKKDEYDEQWTDAFVSALMESEWKDTIAKEWAVKGERKKITQIKGYIVGLLKDAGVLKGSYNSIAEKIGITEESRTFSKYMSDGKKQPYADWVKDYVSGKKNQ